MAFSNIFLVLTNGMVDLLFVSRDRRFLRAKSAPFDQLPLGGG
jgi:hypothetical protein